MYMMPIFLWSTVVTQPCSTCRPWSAGRRGGLVEILRALEFVLPLDRFFPAHLSVIRYAVTASRS